MPEQIEPMSLEEIQQVVANFVDSCLKPQRTYEELEELIDTYGYDAVCDDSEDDDPAEVAEHTVFAVKKDDRDEVRELGTRVYLLSYSTKFLIAHLDEKFRESKS